VKGHLPGVAEDVHAHPHEHSAADEGDDPAYLRLTERLREADAEPGDDHPFEEGVADEDEDGGHDALSEHLPDDERPHRPGRHRTEQCQHERYPKVFAISGLHRRARLVESGLACGGAE